MADLQQHPQYQKESEGLSKFQVLSVAAVVPLGAFLLFLAGITFVGTLIGLAVATPLFVIFSPILVPAAVTIALAVFGFVTAGAFGITALSALSWIVSYFRRVRGSLPQQMEVVKKRAQDAAGQVGQKAKEAGQTVQSKAQEATRSGAQEGSKGQETATKT